MAARKDDLLPAGARISGLIDWDMFLVVWVSAIDLDMQESNNIIKEKPKMYTSVDFELMLCQKLAQGKGYSLLQPISKVACYEIKEIARTVCSAK